MYCCWLFRESFFSQTSHSSTLLRSQRLLVSSLLSPLSSTLKRVVSGSLRESWSLTTLKDYVWVITRIIFSVEDKARVYSYPPSLLSKKSIREESFLAPRLSQGSFQFIHKIWKRTVFEIRVTNYCRGRGQGTLLIR